jgi:hypothetical protein
MKGILFSTEMVRAIVARKKTETRRVVKRDECGMMLRPFAEGDVLWVRETWNFQPCITCAFRDSDCGATPQAMQTDSEIIEGCYLYRADFEDEENTEERRWRPSIHMPRQAARIFLRVTEILPERLWEIDEAGAIAEGLYQGWMQTEKSPPAGSARQAFMWLWQHLTRKEPAVQSWAANPWVWVIRFERCERPDGWPE